jgi:trk system potassium uptake protein TrkA
LKLSRILKEKDFMNVIIIGGGKVGSYLAEHLAVNESYDITIIDKNLKLVNRLVDNIDIQGINGNGARASILIDAGVREADLLIAATPSDELNMVCCLTGKKLGAKHTIARIRDPEYAEELSQLKADIELDMVINPEQAVATEITKLIEFPSFYSVDTFAKGSVEMVSLKVTEGLPLCSNKLKNLAKLIGKNLLIGAIVRGDQVIIPGGEDSILSGDIVYFIGPPSRLFAFATQIGIYKQRIKNVMVIGGGRIGFYLAKSLSERDISVKIVETNYERCLALSNLLPNTLIINGDGSDDKLIISEGLNEMHCMISVTGMDEENLMMALLAKRTGVNKVIAKVNRDAFTELFSEMKIDNIVNPKTAAANSILRYIRGIQNLKSNSSVSTLYRIVEDRAEAIEFTAGEGSALLGIQIKDLKISEGVLIAVIVRRNAIIIPHGTDAILYQDSVIVITKGKRLFSLDDILIGAKA